MARTLSVVMPKMGVSVIDASAISRDEEVVKAYVNDPLVYRGKIRARLGAELINVMERSLPARMSRIELPVLIIHGSEDRLSNPQGSTLLYESVSSKDKTLKFYQGFFHELLNEPGREQALKDIEEWLGAHI
jgi:alpha-beta hydrolase superfamily lysophospholipase